VRPPPRAATSFPSLKGRKGLTHTHRDHSGEYGRQESNRSGTRPRIGSAGLHAAPQAAFLLALLHHTCHTRLGLWQRFLRLRKAKVDYGRGATGKNLTPCCLDANHDRIMNDLYVEVERLQKTPKRTQHMRGGGGGGKEKKNQKIKQPF